MGVVFTNNAETTLAAAITSTSATSISVTSSSTFPTVGAGEYFYATISDGTNLEIVKITAVSGTTWTVVRASDNTTARTFANGSTVQLRTTAALLTDIQENIASKSANQTVYNATAASSATAYDIGINPGVEANAMVFLDGVMQHHDTFSFSGSTLTFDAAPVDGTKIEVIVDNLINLQSSNLTVDTFTATSNQTAFTLSDSPAAEANLIVFINGVFQNQAAYTISSNTLTLDTGVVSGRTVTVYVINPVNIGTPSDGTVTSAKLSGNITTPGTLTVGSHDVAFDSPTFVVDNSNSRVGLGTASPSVPVDIVGDVKMSANLTVDTNTLVVDSSNNRVLVASSTAVTGTTTAKLQINGTDNAGSTISIGRFSANANAPTLQFIKSRNGTVGSNTVVQDGDNLGEISFAASDGSDTATLAAKIFGEVDGTPGSNDMPGRLTFFTTADGASSPTERMRIDSNGNFMVGATTAIDSDSGRGNITLNGSSNAMFNFGVGGSQKGYIYHNGTYLRISNTQSGDLQLQTADTARMTIDSSGNVGIGTSSPTAKLDVRGSVNSEQAVFTGASNSGRGLSLQTAASGGQQDAGVVFDAQDTESGANPYIQLKVAGADVAKFSKGSTDKYPTSGGLGGIGGTGANLHLDGDDSEIRMANNLIHSDNSGNTKFTIRAAYGAVASQAELSLDGGHITFNNGTSFTERMRIDGGSVHIGTTSEANGSTGGVSFSADNNDRRNLICATTGTGNLELIEFRNPNGTVGDIKSNGTSTSYNSSSDYRLKENVEYTWDATSRLKQLKPARFNFKTDNKTTLDGFLAHEVSSIVPEAVSGEKDGEKMQGIDQSKLVPLLVKTIQELEARITELEK